MGLEASTLLSVNSFIASARPAGSRNSPESPVTVTPETPSLANSSLELTSLVETSRAPLRRALTEEAPAKDLIDFTPTPKQTRGVPVTRGSPKWNPRDRWP